MSFPNFLTDSVVPCSQSEKIIFKLPKDCPFSIHILDTISSTYLIREQDKYGEFPNIYARVVKLPKHKSGNNYDTSPPSLIVLSDTGCGTNQPASDNDKSAQTPSYWNLSTFLIYTINPNGKLPYLVMTTHCHYDHILGLNYLPSSLNSPKQEKHSFPKTTVLSSAFDKSFVTPRSHLAAHSLCNDLGIPPPVYTVGIWANDLSEVFFKPDVSSLPVSTGITILQTPGHTPDSLSWYDATMYPPHIFVGDSLYERQSEYTRDAPWGREPLMPTIFDVESDLEDWWSSMAKLIAFVGDRNEELRKAAEENMDGEWLLLPSRTAETARLRLGAAHVTVSADAEGCLLAMKDFGGRILRDEVPCCRLPDERGHEVWLWDDILDVGLEKGNRSDAEDPTPSIGLGRFSVKAPLKIVQRGRERIPRREWCTRDSKDSGGRHWKGQSLVEYQGRLKRESLPRKGRVGNE